jgi:hypothetical protein
MSYARFSNADVYVYLDVGGYFNCCACWLGDLLEGDIFHESFHARSTTEILSHLEEHRQAGHDVPDDCIDRLVAKREENDAFLAAGGRS